jgi:competence ComEA-like helix-hairpin-helix protein
LSTQAGNNGWPRAAQLLVAFFLGVASAGIAIRLQSARPRPIEFWPPESPAGDLHATPIGTVSTAAKRTLLASDTPAAQEILLSPRTGAADPSIPRIKSQTLTAINVNQASREELMQLPGIGPTLAGRIINEREKAPFAHVEDLLRVPGIGAKTLARIRPHIRVDDD